MKKALLLSMMSLAPLMSLQSTAQAASLPAAQCAMKAPAEFAECLNKTVIPDQIEAAQAQYINVYSRLVSAYGLSDSLEKSTDFNQYFQLNKSVPDIEVRTSGIDTQGKDFEPSRWNGKPSAVIESNIRKTVNFVAWFHARSLGRSSSPLFSFRRVEIQRSLDANISMKLKDRTLTVLLPQNIILSEKDLIAYWQTGRVLIPSEYENYPMPVIKFFAGFGTGGTLKKAVLDNWRILDPVGDFRVRLHVMYLQKAEQVKELLKNRPQYSEGQKSQMVSFLLNPEESANSLESLLSFSPNAAGGGGEGNQPGSNTVIINRTTGFCPIKISNSHVINVRVSGSRFQSKADAVETKSAPQNIHVVNDKTYVGLVCVDTHDNVDVSLDITLGTINSALSPEKLIRYAEEHAI